MKPSEMPMFYGAKPVTFERANLLRKSMTPSEKKLWQFLKNKQLNRLRFRRQHPINIFIADFYCHSAKLVVELDGEIHLDKERNGILEGQPKLKILD